MTSCDDMVKLTFGQKSIKKLRCTTFTPSPRPVMKKINELQAISFDEEYAYDAQNGAAPPRFAKSDLFFLFCRVYIVARAYVRGAMYGGECALRCAYL